MAETKGRWNDARFIQRELSDDERKTLKAMPFWDEDWDSALLRMEDEGYQLTLKFDAWSKAYACFISDAQGRTQNKNCILSGRGSTPTKALRQALFKHGLAPDGVWFSLEAPGSSVIDD